MTVAYKREPAAPAIPKRPTLAALLLVSLLSVSGVVHAEQDMEGLLDGFDDSTLYDSIELDKSKGLSDDAFAHKRWQLDGRLATSSSWNLHDHQSGTGTDYSGLSKLRARLDLSLHGQLSDNWKARASLIAWHDGAYALQDADYTPEVLAAYENELNSGDVWLQGKLADQWDIKLGRQVVVWGFSDNLRVLDTLNPLDNLEPGLADIEDLRRPVGMLKLDHYRGPWQISLIATPEQRFSRNPPFGSDFYALNDEQGQAVQYREVQPKDFDSIDTALAIIGRFSGWDLSLNLAHQWRDDPFLDARAFDASNPGADEAQFQRDSVLRHSRINLYGLGLQFTQGSWLFRSEAAWLDNVELTSSGLTPTSPLANLPLLGVLLPGGEAAILPMGARETQEQHVLLGLEYFGLSNSNISLDLAARHIADFDTDLAWSDYLRWRSETALRFTRDLLQERLRVNAIAVLFNRDGQFWNARGGAVYRIDGDYELAQAWRLRAGVVFYQSGDQAPFRDYGDNDRVFAELEWAF